MLARIASCGPTPGSCAPPQRRPIDRAPQARRHEGSLLPIFNIGRRHPHACAELSSLVSSALRMHRVSWQRTGSLMSIGAYGPAMTLMDRVCDDLGDDISAMSPPALSVWGSAHLRSAILAARASGSTSPGQAQDAWAHIDAAKTAAARMSKDRNDYGLAFGPSNVAQHEVAVAVELENGDEAIRRSRTTRLSPATPSIRVGHHHIDLARGYVMAGDHAGGLRHL